MSVSKEQYDQLVAEFGQIRRDFGSVISYVEALHRAVAPLLPQIQANEEVDEQDVRRRRLTHPNHHHVIGHGANKQRNSDR